MSKVCLTSLPYEIITRICLSGLDPQDVLSLALTSKSLADTIRFDQDCNRGPSYALQKCNHDAINYYLEQELYTLDELLFQSLEVDSPESLQHLLDRYELPVTYKIMDHELIFHCLSERCFNHILSRIDLTEIGYGNLGKHVVTLGNYRCMSSLLQATKRYDNDITVNNLQYPFKSTEEELEDYYKLLECLTQKMTDSQYNHMIYNFFRSYGKNHGGVNGYIPDQSFSDSKITDSQAANFINRILTSRYKENEFMILRFIEDRYFESYHAFVMKFNIRKLYEYKDTMSEKLQRNLYTIEELERLYRYHQEAYGESLSHIYTNKMFVNSLEFPSHLREKPNLYNTPEFFTTMVRLCNNQNILEYKDRYSYCFNHLHTSNQVSRYYLKTEFKTDLTPEELGFLNSYIPEDLGFLNSYIPEVTGPRLHIDISINTNTRSFFPPVSTSILDVTADKPSGFRFGNTSLEIVDEPEIEVKNVKSCGCVLNEDEECECETEFDVQSVLQGGL